MQSRQMVRAVRPGSRSAIELLGYLQQLSRDTADGDRRAVLDGAVDIPVRCLEIDKALLLQRVTAGDGYSTLSHANLSAKFLENWYLLREEILDPAAITQRLKMVLDTATLSRGTAALCADEGVESLSCIPVIGDAQTTAILLYMYGRPASPTIWEIELLNTLANHTAIALSQTPRSDESRTPSETETASEDLHFAHEWINDIRMSSGSLDELLRRLLDAMVKTMRADSGSIMLCDDGETHVAASVGLPNGSPPQSDNTVASCVLSTGQPTVIHGRPDKNRFPGVVARTDIVSAISTPLRGRRGVVGLLNISRSKTQELFTDREQALISHLSHRIASTVENARLHEAAKFQTRHLGTLYKMARTITSSLDLGAVCQTVMERVHSLCVSDACVLMLDDDKTGELKLTCVDGFSQEAVPLVTPPILQMAASRQRPLVLHEHSGGQPPHRGWCPAETDMRSAVFVPLWAKRKRIGVLAAYSRKQRAFPQPIVKLLVGFGELAAIAIDNARLYERQMAVAEITEKLLTPGRPVSISGFDIGCRHTPAYRVGGDYYDIIKLSDRKYGLVIADVSGKDATAAAHIGMCKHSLRAAAGHVASPAVLLSKMNSVVHENTDRESFISMFYGVLDIRTRQLTFSSAGHEPAIFYRASVGRTKTLTTEGILLGVLPSASYCQRSCHIRPGDVLVLYTDGLLGALAPSYENTLEEIERHIVEHPLKPAQELADNIHELAMATCSGKSPDDIALMVAKGV